MNHFEIGAVRLAGGYTPGGETLHLRAQSPILETWPCSPNLVRVCRRTTMGQYDHAEGRYWTDGLVGHSLVGLKFLEGTDGPWEEGDVVIMWYDRGHAAPNGGQ
jgi:hypothetical protein